MAEVRTVPRLDRVSGVLLFAHLHQLRLHHRAVRCVSAVNSQCMLAPGARLSAAGVLPLPRILLSAYLLFGTAVTLAALDLGVSALHSCADNILRTCSFSSLFCKWPAIILSLCRALLWRSEISVFDAMLLPYLRAGKRRSVRGQPAPRQVGGRSRIPIT